MTLQDGVLKIAKAAGGFAMARLAAQHQLRILAYHGLWITPGHQFGDRLFMSPQQFERRMTWLKRSRYKVISLDEAFDTLRTGGLPPNCVVITIDDGWKSTYTHMLPVLESLQLPATVYVTTWYVKNQAPIINVALRYILERTGRTDFFLPTSGQKFSIPLGDMQRREEVASSISSQIHTLPSLENRLEALRHIAELLDVPTEPWWSNGQFHLMIPSEIKDASDRGLDIQLHTHRHTSRAAQLTAEIDENRQFLSTVCGFSKLDHFCYPSGNFDDAAIGILAQCGIRTAVTCEGGLTSARTPPYRIPRFLDGRSISQTKFEAYLSGLLEFYALLRKRDRLHK